MPLRTQRPTGHMAKFNSARAPKSRARDGLQERFAGHENKGPASNEKQTFRHSTTLKGRQLGHQNAQDLQREPGARVDRRHRTDHD